MNLIRDIEAGLEMARRHVAQAKRIVERQIERIEALKRDERSTARADASPEVFLTTLKTFEDHERSLLDEADAVRRWSETTPLRMDSATGFAPLGSDSRGPSSAWRGERSKTNDRSGSPPA
jgi:hypothetical protein